MKPSTPCQCFFSETPYKHSLLFNGMRPIIASGLPGIAPTLERAELADEKSTLLELEGGKIAARMNAARGHCIRIDNIFNRYLSPWFKRILQPDEVSMMGNLFTQLSSTDGMMLEAIDNVSNVVTASQSILDLVDQEKFWKPNSVSPMLDELYSRREGPLPLPCVVFTISRANFIKHPVLCKRGRASAMKVVVLRHAAKERGMVSYSR